MAVPKCRDKVGVCSEVIEDEIAHTIRNCNPLAAFLQRREPVEKRIVRTHGAFHGDAPGNGLFIHVDGKADIGAFAALGKTGRVCFVEPRTKVYWGGFGMVESTLRLFSATRDGGFRYVVLISGDTLPLYRTYRFGRV